MGEFQLKTKFTIDAAVLKEVLPKLNAVTAVRTTMPILSCVAIKAENGTVTMRTCNLQVQMSVKTKADVEAEGGFAIEGKLLGNMVRKAPSNVGITFEAQGKSVVRISHPLSAADSEPVVYETMVSLYENFPLMPTVEGNNATAIETNAEELGHALKEVLHWVEKDDEESLAIQHPTLMGVLFELNTGENALRTVATDGYRLTYKTMECASGADNTNGAASAGGTGSTGGTETLAIAPGENMSRLIKMLNGKNTKDNTVCIASDGNRLQVTLDDTKCKKPMGVAYTFDSLLMDGAFIDYKRLLKRAQTQQPSWEYAVDTEEMRGACDRINTLMKNTTNKNYEKYAAKCAFDNNGLQIECATPLGRAEEIIRTAPTNSGAEAICTGFNMRYLTDAFKSLPYSEIHISIGGSALPLMITAPENSGFLAMVLPVRL